MRKFWTWKRLDLQVQFDMPEFDLRGMKVAKYNYDKTQKKISYDTPMSMGDAMTANLELKFAEGRLYAESALAEYMKKVTENYARYRYLYQGEVYAQPLVVDPAYVVNDLTY